MKWKSKKIFERTQNLVLRQNGCTLQSVLPSWKNLYSQWNWKLYSSIRGDSFGDSFPRFSWQKLIFFSKAPLYFYVRYSLILMGLSGIKWGGYLGLGQGSISKNSKNFTCWNALKWPHSNLIPWDFTAPFIRGRAKGHICPLPTSTRQPAYRSSGNHHGNFRKSMLLKTASNLPFKNCISFLEKNLFQT